MCDKKVTLTSLYVRCILVERLIVREIKFRGIYKDRTKPKEDLKLTLQELFELATDNYDPGYYPYEDYYWCQFTGLKDKDGKEIYEGDIVRQPRCKCEGCLPLGTYRTYKIHDMNYLSGNTEIARSDWIEIIGNIHENPELLLEVK